MRHTGQSLIVDGCGPGLVDVYKMSLEGRRVTQEITNDQSVSGQWK